MERLSRLMHLSCYRNPSVVLMLFLVPHPLTPFNTSAHIGSAINSRQVRQKAGSKRIGKLESAGAWV